MTDKTAPDLAETMSRLLEQELMAAIGLDQSPAEPSPADQADAGADVADDPLDAEVLSIAAAALRMAPEDLDPTENLANFGIDSIAITEIMVRISRFFSITVAPTTFFEARNLSDLAHILRQRHGKAIAAHYAAAAPAAPPPPAAAQAAPRPDRDDDVAGWLTRHRTARRPSPNPAANDAAPIAIIAMDGRFPRSPDLDALEHHLRDGDDCISEIPADRWDWRSVWGDPRKGAYCDVKWGGFVDDVDRFDATFFRIARREAELMDPQHRLFMECVWSLIERAGYAPGALSGKRVGLFLGINLLDYIGMVNRSGIQDAQQMTGLGHAFCPNRLSFLLDVHGPSQVVDTACSSSAVAIHRAVMAIRHEGCEMAIAGGSNLLLSADQHILFSQIGMLSPGGRCRSFAAGADGYTRADGVGAVLLKRLDLAERDGDPILGIIRASVETHGGTATSLTAPNPVAQARLIADAIRQAAIDPRSVTLVECHGTGTALGDPIEVQGLKTAFAQLYAERGLPAPTAPHCGLGSVKSNIGHTETAAGVAGLIKLLLAMRSGIRYRSLHCDTPNPLIDLHDSPFFLLQEAQAWNRPVVDGVEQPRRAGLSSFGAGGNYVHMVVEEYRPAAAAPVRGPRPAVIPLSARTEDLLARTVAALRPFVAAADLDDLAHTLRIGRDDQRARVAFVVRDGADLSRQMDDFLAGRRDGIAHGVAARHRQIAAITDSDPADIAARWVAGDGMDWSRLDSAPRRRLSLPPTPFEPQRYWLPRPEAATGFDLRPHGEECWRVTVRGTEFFLADHCLRGTPILPGVAYLELARAAAARAGLAAATLRNVVWVQPLAVSQPREVEIRLDRAAALVEITSVTAEDRTLHAQIRLGDGSPAALGESHDLDRLRAAHATAWPVTEIYAAFDRMGLNYGPGHRALTGLFTGPGPQVLAHLVLPPQVAETRDAFVLHPSLMDGAFQAAIGMNLGNGTPDAAALPFAIDRVEMLAPLAPEMWVHVRPAHSDIPAPRVQTLDIDIMDARGTVCVRLRGFATRLPAATRHDSVLTFAPRWRTPERTAAVTPAERRLVTVEESAPLAERFAHLSARLLHEVRTGGGLIQVAIPDGPDAAPLAGVIGMLRSASLERPGLRGQVVICPVEADESLRRRILDDAATAPAGAKLRWDDGALWQEEWQPVELSPAPTPWADGKVYLITGGLGGIGRQLTAAIRAAAPGAVVVVSGRTCDDAARTWLAAQGTGVHFIAADMGDAQAVAALVDGIRRRHGRLDGVLHAAGVLCDGPLERKTPEQLQRVLAAKVTGTVALDQALGDQPLDFLVLFSSISAVWGNPGQTDYAAANGFLDGFAAAREVRRRAGLVAGRTVAVAWPLWAEGGMRLDEHALTLMTRTTGLVPLTTADAVATLAMALTAPTPRLLVAVGDADKIRRRMAPAPLAQPPAAAVAVASPALEEKLLAALTAAAARQLKVAIADLAEDEELTEYGFDSIGFTQFTNGLNDQFGLELTPTVFFEHPTLRSLAAHLAHAFTAILAPRLGIEAGPAPVAAPVAAAVAPMPRPLSAPLPAMTARSDDAVAIIGMSGVFPGAADVEALWDNLAAGRDSIGEIPAQRWDWRTHGTIAQGGFIDGIARFDAAFFGLSAPEARMMDPQQRLLLTLAWRLFEDAGIPPRRLAGSDTGVFVGIADTGYGRLLAQGGAGIEGHAMTGLAPSLGPNRISFHFNLHGPSVAVETACSSALVAVHRAVEAIHSGTCEAALAGGINTLLLPDPFIGFAKAGMLAPDGRCKPFSADANGYVRGEGAGLVLLKRLDAARRDGDRILAVIRASGENHGGRASSLTAPNPKAQAALLRATYGRAGFDPRSVSYVEAHGTGTPLGDPIEVEALRAAFADLCREAETRFGPAPAMRCGLGSVKSNIGHLELAAGIAGLIKVLLQMRHGTLAPSLHCQTLNPYLKLEGSPFQVVREATPWTRPLDRDGTPLPRRAGISSFGFGGANAHVVVEEYLGDDTPAAETPAMAGPALMVLSAHSEEALQAVARQVRDLLARHDPHRIAAALQTRREAMEHRLAFTAASAAEAVLRLEAFLAGDDDPALHRGRVKRSRGAVSVLESDPEVARAIAGLATRGRADGLLEVWVKGFAVDWTALHGMTAAHTLPLPGYPLAATEYWPSSTPTVVAPIAAPVVPVTPVPLTPPPPAVDVVDPAQAALTALTDIAARVLEVRPEVLDPDAELGEFGFDSITMTGFAAKVNAELALSLTPADFFEFATLNRLARHIAGTFTPPAPQPRPAPIAAQPLAAPPVARISAPVDNGAAIAIVGFSCRFPQAWDGDAFWDNLSQGRDCISRIPADRWDWRAYDGDPKQEQGKTNIHWGGFIDGVFEFDPLFFGISPREAKLMDPQQRLLMMHVWKAIEDSGHSPRSLAGRRVGLFVGTSSSGYREIIGDDTGAEGYVATGAVPSVGPNRISFFLDWHGPSEPVETACSSSLVALHRAMQAMRAGDCDMAVIGGVNTIVTPEAHINFAKAGMLSPDGRCKTFSTQANGYVRGEGVGMVVLKFLSEAERDGDPILAVVRASAVNHGGRANSLTAPNTAAQAELLREAQERAGIDPASIGYIEAHGTGTALGDPVEINALKTAFRAAAGGRIGLGTVKSNIGHLELAAGAAGLIKVLLQMRHRTLAPSLHCAEINPYIDLTGTPFHIVRQAEEWRPATATTGEILPLRAGLSSFGFGGVNAHVIVEEYRGDDAAPARHDGPLVAVLSARDGERLKEQARNLLAFIDKERLHEPDLADLTYTLQLGRDAMKHRLAVVVRSLADLRSRLAAFLDGDSRDSARLEAGYKPGAAIDPSGLSADEIAARWLAGTEVDWTGLYPERRRRLRLPTYPFAREVYHINATFAGAAAPRPAEGFSRRLAAEDFFLRDHRVRGARILPGAMGLELARAAFAAADGFTPVALRRVVWQHPLRLDSGSITATIPLAAAEGSERGFRLLSGGGHSTPHMLGLVAPLTAPTAATLDHAAIRARCPTMMSADRVYDRYARLGLEYGPAFRAVAELFTGTGEALARLVLPSAASAAGFALHPSMVDAAFQAAIGLFPEDGTGTMALPFGLDLAEVLAPTTATMWAHVRRTGGGNGIHKLDIDLADADGRLCLRLRGFTLRDVKTPQPAGDEQELNRVALAHLTALVAREAAIPVAEIEAEAALEAYGIDSVMIVRLTDALEADFGPLPKTLFFEYRTLVALAAYFTAHHAATLARLSGEQTPPPGGGMPRPPATIADTGPAAPLPVAAGTPIAIIGMAGHFPGGGDLNQFWRNLEAGRDCISEIPAERWDHSRFYAPEPGQPGKTNSKWGGFLEGIDCFDPLFFNISPREAEYLDPQERLFLQCAWETLEDAGYPCAALPAAAPPLDGADVGVFVGVMYEEYQLYGAERTAAGQPLALSGSAASIANRVSYFCGLHGPSLAVDSMCSSSLSAIHLACDALRAGSCRMALAGGVNLSLHPNKYLGLAQSHFMSSTGRCESFGQGGDGYVPGEGVGAVLLKPLAQAEADGDRILGVIRASALNHGGHTNGYTVPNPAAQAAVIGRALAAAAVDARMVSYVEAHGTGTALGDPIEIAALSRAYGAHTADTGFCAIGSVKSNIGHCESAAGIAGLAKVLLQMRHRTLAPSLHSRILNPGIDFASTPFTVQQHAAPWRRPVVNGHEMPRIAGLSSFGAGGANAHLIIEEYQEAPHPVQPARPHVFPLSASDPERLAEMIQRLRQALDSLDEGDLADIAWTLQTGREAFKERLAVIADSLAGLKAALDNGGGLRGRAIRGHGAAAATDPQAVAAAWVAGARIDWAALHPAPLPRRIALPPYPFARERYWVPGSTPAVAAPATVAAPPPHLPLLFTPQWRESAAIATATAAAHRLVVLVEPPPHAAAALVAALAPAQVEVLAPAPFADHAARLLSLLKDLFRQRPDSALVQVAAPSGHRAEALAGLLRGARLERPGLRCQMVTLDLDAADAAHRLLTDQTSGDDDIRHQGERRLVRSWRELSPSPAARPWRSDGVYLVTGGAGGVGRHVCDDILTHAPGAVLWLVGRSAPPSLPPSLHYRRADVTDDDAMAAVVAEIMATHGRLTGIIHAAGLTRDMLLVRKSEADLRAVLAPKVTGVLALDRATAGIPLDFMVLFASVSGALGNAGQADYAAANAFLDLFAEQRNRMVERGERHGHTLSIDWPYWQDGGMRLGGEVIAAMDRAVGARPLETASALAALAAVLTLPDPDQVLVLEGAPDRLRAMVRPTAPSSAPPSLPRATAPAAMLETVGACVSEVLRVPRDKLAVDEPLDRYGLDSVSALEIVAALERHVGPLPPTILFENPTIGQLAGALTPAAPAAPAPESEPVPPTVRSNDIAIIAIDGRYPGADTPEDLWTALEAGRDLIVEVPAERWDPTYSPTKGKPGASHCKWGGFLSNVDCFDAAFFGYSPRAADLADPQERLFLETTWRLLERGGHTRPMLRQHYDGRVGVFVGAMYQHYGTLDTDPDSAALVRLASYSTIANRVSFFFDLQGPSVAVDSMCSSALESVHLACQSLRAGECRLAIAGGVNLSLDAGKYRGLSRTGLAASSPDSRSFADGDGYLPAEAVGAVLLKPLADALRDGDPVVAVIKSSAANHGGHSAGFGVPSADAQARLIGDAVTAAAIDIRTLGYLEAAANGARLGDSIELRAAAKAFSALGAAEGAIAIGAIKSNMGHAEAASGMAQLTKTVLQLQHRRLAPTLKPARANPALAFTGTPFRPVWQGADWPAPMVDGRPQPRRAAISSFGAGGSNVHLVVEEAPHRPSPVEAERPRAFPVSARTPEQLAARLRDLAAFVRATPELSLARLSRTLRQGRETLDHQVVVVAKNRDHLRTALDAARPGDPMPTLPEVDPMEGGPVLVLPPYPFARERHWLPEAPRTTTAAAPDLLALIRTVLAAELGTDTIAADASFATLGLDSMIALRLAYAIEEATGLRLERAAFETQGSPRLLARWLAEQGTPAFPSPPEPSAVATGMPWRMAMTEGQKGLWAIQALHPDTAVYNVPVAFRLDGIVSEALERACAWLYEVYPLLSARVDGTTLEMVAAPVSPALTRCEVPKGMDPLAFARGRAAVPFDLTVAPACRMELLGGGALGAGHHILVLTAHHMVFDGASAAAAAAALWQAYGDFAAGRVPQRPHAADFTDFAAWERGLLDSAAGQTQAAYWREMLSGDLPVVELPADRPAQPGTAVDGRTLERLLDASLAKTAKDSAARLGVTPAAWLLGVLSMLVYRHCGQGDMVIGVPVLRRPERRFAATIGYCANMIGLRIEVSGADSAETVIRRVHARLVEGLGHADYPFAGIARDLDGALHGEPPYQISFAYQNFAFGAPPALPPGSGHAEFLPELRQPGDGPFGLEIHEDGDGLRLVAGYDGARFDAGAIDRLLDRFVRLTARVCETTTLPVRDLEMMAPGERRKLLGRRSRPPALPRRAGLTADWIMARAKSHPDAVAVTADGHSVSYRRLVRRANRLARLLRKRGVKRGNAVAVLLERDADSIAALLACLSLGAVWVPLDCEAPQRRLDAMLADCRPVAAITRRRTIAAVATVVDLEHEADALVALPGRRLRGGPAPDDDAYMIYTSGSTGTPKGVVVSQRALAEHVRAIADHFSLDHDDVVLHFAPQVVDTALEQILPSLAAGARVLVRTGGAWAPDDLHRVMEQQGVTVADLPPAYLREVLLAWGEVPPPGALRLLVVGGEALAPDTVRLWQGGPLAAIPLINAYGPTEATITCLTHRVDAAAPPGAAVPIGRPLPGTRALVLDRDGNPLPEGVIGELHIGGNRLARGYHGRPDLTADRFVSSRWGRLYRTGDLASWLPGGKGTIAFHGRIDHQVKVRGFRVELAEVEAALAEFGLREAAVVPRRDTLGDSMLVAYVVPFGDGLDETALRAHMAARLPSHMLPAAYVRLDALPATAAGKLDHAALPAPATRRDNAPQRPRDALERQLAQIWARVLGRDASEIGIHDDFQVCGGHSLAWVRLLAEIGRVLGHRPDAATFMPARTIAEQAPLLRLWLADRDSVPAHDGTIVPLRPAAGPATMTLFLVHAAAGTVSCYVDLARRLAPGIAVYGIQAGDDPGHDLGALAERHVAAVRALQPHGPYVLGGWSMGGVIAQEMARRLRDAGQEVALVALLDSYTPAQVARFDALETVSGGDPIERAFRRDVLGLTEEAALPGGDEGEHLAALLRRYRALAHMLAAHDPRPAAVPLVLLRAQGGGDDDGRGWLPLAATGLRVFPVPGDHSSLLRGDDLEACAALLNDVLTAAQVSG